METPTVITREQPGHTAMLLIRSPLDDHRSSAVDRQTLLAADRRGVAYLVYRDRSGVQRLIVLDRARGSVTLGRGETADVSVPWDRGVSREHATLVTTADGWAIVDDGNSLNGTFVNRERMRGRRALRDRDLIQIGEVGLAFRDPSVTA